MEIGLSSYLAVAAILFTIGVVGIFLNRKNIIIILMSIELILLAVNLNFVAFSAYLGDLVGQVFALFVLTVAAAPGISNAETIGRVLYTSYVYYFQAAGLVLLVAMIGAIVLTLKHKPGVRRQSIADQVARTPATGMRVVQIKSGEGIAP